MPILNWLRKVWHNENDALAEYRVRIVVPVSQAALVPLSFFAVNNFWQGRPVVGLAVSLVLVVLLLNVVALRRGGAPPVPYVLMMMPAIAGMLGSVVQQGVPGALWAYPTTLICYFVLTRRMALMFSLVILLTLSAAAVVWIDPDTAARLFVSLLLTVIMINVVLNVMGQLQDTLVLQSVTDALTGAHNRRHLDRTLAHVVEMGRRRRPGDALLMIDIDHFKHVNDRLGHDGGDEVLRRLVHVLKARLRRTDMVFRMGGEEFVALLRDTDGESAVQVAEGLRSKVEQTALLPGLALTISIGICAQTVGQGVEPWLKAADLALYRAKNGGRNRVESARAEGSW